MALSEQTEDYLAQLTREAQDFPIGGGEWSWRCRAAWNIMQMRYGIPACDWEPVPSWFWRSE